MRPAADGDPRDRSCPVCQAGVLFEAVFERGQPKRALVCPACDAACKAERMAGEHHMWGLSRLPADDVQAVVTRLAGVLLAVGGYGGVAVAGSVELFDLHGFAHPGTLLVVALVAAALGSFLLWLGWRAPGWLSAIFPPLVLGLIVVVPVFITSAQFAIGPRSEIAIVLYVEVPIFTFWLMWRWVAILLLAVVPAQFAVVLAVQRGYILPGIQVAFLAIVLASIAYVFSRLIAQGENEALRLARLGRFLSPQVTETVVSEGNDLLEPHRRKVAVFFIDLRGFTRFSTTAEPEEIMEVLGEYFTVVGKAIRQADATVGMLAGDGIMGFFGDPIPCDDPADRAVALTRSLCAPMRQLTESWQRRGLEIDYGAGIALGYATLGVVGFEGRSDYTAIGAVVNLAARLSDAALPGETLVDARLFGDLARRPDAEHRLLTLKGFPEALPAYRLVD